MYGKVLKHDWTSTKKQRKDEDNLSRGHSLNTDQNQAQQTHLWFKVKSEMSRKFKQIVCCWKERNDLHLQADKLWKQELCLAIVQWAVHLTLERKAAKPWADLDIQRKHNIKFVMCFFPNNGAGCYRASCWNQCICAWWAIVITAGGKRSSVTSEPESLITNSAKDLLVYQSEPQALPFPPGDGEPLSWTRWPMWPRLFLP